MSALSKHKGPSKPWHEIEVQEQMFDEIVGRITNGESLAAVCRDQSKQYPSPASFLHWVQNNPAFAKRYARAMQIRADVNAELVLDTAREEPNPMRARNVIDALRWHAAKLAPKKYGDRVFSENETTVNVQQKVDFTAIPQEVRQKLREALMLQLNPPTIDGELAESEQQDE